MALERLELTIQLETLPLAHEWVHRTLRTIASPAFSEFVIWVMKGVYPWRSESSSLGWAAVESSLDALAECNPDFRVLLRGELPLIHGTWCGSDGTHSFFQSYLPIIPPKSFVKYESVSNVENRVWGSFVP